MGMWNIERGLWVAGLVAQVLLIGALLTRGLAKRFPFFTCYLGSEVIWGLLLMQLDYRTLAYAEAFRIYAFMMLVLRLGAAAELFERICEYFRGIGSFRFLIAGTGVVLTAIFAVAMFRPEVLHFPQGMVEEIERWETQILTGVFVFTWAFFRITLAHRPTFEFSVRAHWTIFASYLAISSSARFLHILSGGSWIHPINIGMLAGDLVCFVAWIKTMQVRPVVPLPEVTEEERVEAERRLGELLLTMRELAAGIRKR